MRHCRTYLSVLPGLRVQDLEIPWAAAVCQAVRAAEPGGFRHGDPTDAVHRLRSFPLDLSVRGGNPYTVRKSLSKVRYASKGLPSLLLKPLIRDVLPLVTRSAIWLSVSCFSPLLRKTVRGQSTLLHLATFG